MTDDEVIGLYRALLGRDPENAGTIAAFRRYYPTLEHGRRAVFTSEEFDTYFARVTGRAPQGRDHLAGALALALLEGASVGPPPTIAADPALRTGMQRIFPRAEAPRLALVIGTAPGLALADLLPLREPGSAILHVAPDHPPVVPLVETLADGTSLFRLRGDVDAIAGLLQRFGRRVDALCLLGPPASTAWVEALRPHLARRCLVLTGPSHAGFDAAALSDNVSVSSVSEPVQHWRGLHLHHMGGWLLPVIYAPPASLPPPPDRAATPSLAIAAIVRDEAACVVNMLRSTQGIGSFYALLDTGSADATLALAQDFLTASGLPHTIAQRDHTLFDDDFAAMRNAALAMVPDTIDWVLMLDADEELVQEDFAPLLHLIASGTHDAYALPRYNFAFPDKTGQVLIYPDRQTRLLRNRPHNPIGYTGAVHETVEGVARGMPPLDESAVGGPRGGPHIHHLVRRFRTPEQEALKQAFYRDIARRRKG